MHDKVLTYPARRTRIPFFGQKTGAAVRSLRFVPPQEIGNLIMQSKRNLI